MWGLQPDFYYCQTVAGLLMWGALSDERTGISFTIAAGPRQRSHSRVRVPWDSQSYFTVSDSRLPFSTPPTTRRATVEVFDPDRENIIPFRIQGNVCLSTSNELFPRIYLRGTSLSSRRLTMDICVTICLCCYSVFILVTASFNKS
jgi:hypothetical protein